MTATATSGKANNVTLANRAIVMVVEAKQGKMKRTEVYEAAAALSGLTVAQVANAYNNSEVRRSIQSDNGVKVVSVKGYWYASDSLLGDSDDPGVAEAMLRLIRSAVTSHKNVDHGFEIAYATATPAIRALLDNIQEAAELRAEYEADLVEMIGAL